MSHHANLNRSAAIASVSAALLLLGLKGWAAWSTGSTAMLGSLADTVLDLVASLATLLGVWIAAQPADDKHRFGHGKAEAIAALFQIVLISISALGIASRAIEQFLSGARVEEAASGIGVSVAAIVVTFALLAWQRRVIRKTGSLAITTDNVHYQSDLLLNLAVIAALALDQYAGLKGADPLFGLGIAAWLGWGAWNASEQVIDQLMDHEWPEEKKQRFLDVLARYPDITGVHDLRTRTSGNKDFVQFHIWVDPKLTVRQAHRVMDEIEMRLHAEFPDVEILIHPDPEGLVNEVGDAGKDVLPPIRVNVD
ncbi:cation diffusion facilitator family transporter [Novosphingobium mangrovi (ex Huang et al. 2023)]|uniref:Cation diffusion facilitator family transporter n=1 Tax=Novosphingobium mangrovi (ex Huang et al. 2023) TaxID=2976432 RepID=A0ABT2I8T3_9SPHN|nr:cation diffusion facilitator family transporter [Novosphingobium mangrovi (ex Huang et al. 2023)]MCT2401229.1 cation diffusion facilitator family transporter [Novosphingobium mangrovi (ex Huang et al. 2023)]